MGRPSEISKGISNNGISPPSKNDFKMYDKLEDEIQKTSLEITHNMSWKYNAIIFGLNYVKEIIKFGHLNTYHISHSIKNPINPKLLVIPKVKVEVSDIGSYKALRPGISLPSTGAKVIIGSFAEWLKASQSRDIREGRQKLLDNYIQGARDGLIGKSNGASGFYIERRFYGYGDAQTRYLGKEHKEFLKFTLAEIFRLRESPGRINTEAFRNDFNNLYRGLLYLINQKDWHTEDFIENKWDDKWKIFVKDYLADWPIFKIYYDLL